MRTCKNAFMDRKRKRTVLVIYHSIHSLFKKRPSSCSLLILRTEVESRPDVGSSRIKIRGFVRSSVPMFVRFRSPPETSMMGVSTQRCRCSRVTTASTSAILRLLDHERGSRNSAVYVSWSLMVTALQIERTKDHVKWIIRPRRVTINDDH